MPQRTVLRCYLDDSGEKEYGANTSRYFVYAGVIVDRAVEPDLSREIDELKVGTFGTATVEIKSNWLRIPRERQARYLAPFHVSEQQLTAFVEAFYKLMRSDRLTYLAAAIDKPQMLARYQNSAWYPSATAYQLLLQRYQMHAAGLDAIGQITIDDMSGSTPKKNQWRDLLRSHHNRLKRDGCQMTKMRFTNLVDAPRFGSSERFNLLQIADLVAYNVFRQFRDNGDAWDRDDAKAMKTYKHLDPLLKRFRLGPRNRIEGWGIVKWPHERASRWRVKLTE
jgi:hypothetical protein